MTEQFAPIPLSEQIMTMPIAYRCWCGAEFPSFMLGDREGTDAAEKVARAHRITHRTPK